ncbi:phosphatase PAP2 family protein [Micromonospora sp. M12]
MAFLLVLPGWARRWLAVPGAAGVSVIASATMIAGWHRFSDVLGGVLLGVTVFCLAAAALTAWPGDPGRPMDRTAAAFGAAWPRGAGLVVLVWALVVVVPGLAASVQRGRSSPSWRRARRRCSWWVRWCSWCARRISRCRSPHGVVRGRSHRPSPKDLMMGYLPTCPRCC